MEMSSASTLESNSIEKPVEQAQEIDTSAKKVEEGPKFSVETARKHRAQIEKELRELDADIGNKPDGELEPYV